MPIVFVEPVIDNSMRALCQRRYPNHPKGCPNYGKRDTCPPEAPFLENYFDLSKPILAVWVAFNLGLHRNTMAIKHPNWTRRQLDCCLYWQSRVNAWLRRDVEFNLSRQVLFGKPIPKMLIAAYIPEAMGTNVTATMKNVGVELEWPPEEIVIKVAFVGVPSRRMR